MPNATPVHAVRQRTSHSGEIEQVYARAVAGSPVRRRFIEPDACGRVHLLEAGEGPPLVLLHGGGAPAGLFLPLLSELRGVHALAPDRPGHGLSDPIALTRSRFRETAVAWVDRVLDALEPGPVALLGHSGGAMWALWYALARPDRVERLVLIGPPAVPKTRCPLPIRVAGTPGLAELLAQLAPPSPKAVLRFAHHAAREGATLARYPDLVDLLAASLRDPIADRTSRTEERVFVSPLALVSASGFRRRARLGADELRRLAMPTLVIWGAQEPLGPVSVARAVTEQIPQARLDVPAGGHGPWLGQPAELAATITGFVDE
jgi:pimeloyl-ACP methyl ester carboxylesterase